MREPIVVVGSGASGVHFAKTIVDAGRPVTMLDVGHAAPEAVLPERPLNALKRELPDPHGYFLGRDFESVILPSNEEEYYGFPPSKSHVFRAPNGRDWSAAGFAPLFSFAQGGLAEAWTGGCYPFTDEELSEYPFGLADLLPHYEEVARRIGISGQDDPIAPWMPLHGGLMPPLDPDAHTARLLSAYTERREELWNRHRFVMGRARLAVLSREHDGRPPCNYLGRCLWGCPTKSLYVPSITLAELREDDRFTYVSGMKVRRFRTDSEGRIRGVVALDLPSGAEREFPVGTLVLAAGTLQSSKILLESIHADTGETPELTGLSDNRQILVPFLSPGLVGRSWESETYQYHQLALGIVAGDAGDYVHGLVTTLKTALIHPIVQSLPGSLGLGLRVFRDAHAALGLVNLNFADRRRPGNTLRLEPGADGAEGRLAIRYEPEPGEGERLMGALGTLRAVLRRLGARAPKAMSHVRPMGASVHYTGTLPMGGDGGRFTSDADGRSRDYENLYLADGATFPFLPAKNLTFTLMANAIRIARILLG